RLMSRSTRSSSRIQGGKSPARREAINPASTIVDAINKINGLIESFVASATEVQMSVSSEIAIISKKEQNMMVLIGTDKEGFEKLCSRLFQIQNKNENHRSPMDAVKYWTELMELHSITSLSELGAKMRRDVCSTGRNLAASLFITGNIYSGLAILKEVVEMSEHDPHSAVVLLRWLVRFCEWEAMEKFLESDRKRKKSNFEGFEELVELCGDILDFHRYPKGREERAIKMMKTCDRLNEAKDKTFQLYESQVLLFSLLSLASKVAGIRVSNMMDPLYCIDLAYQKAETLAKSRWPSFGLDKELSGLKTKTDNSIDYLKTAAAMAEYFDVLRMNVNEYLRCGIVREPLQYSYVGLCYAVKLGFTVWISEAFTLLLSSRLRSEADKEEIILVKKSIHAIFTKEEEVSCLTPIKDQLHRLSPPSGHFPSPSSPCNCRLCQESADNPTLAFFCSRLSYLCSGHSTQSIESLEKNYCRIRSQFAPLQQKLMNNSREKPRAPSWICDEMGASIVSFLLSPMGISLGRKDKLVLHLLDVATKICAYSSQLCLPYRLILRHVKRNPRDAISFPWMSRKSIIAKLADLSIGSEGRGRRTPSRSPFLPSSNTPKGVKSAKDPQKEKEDEEEGSDYASYAHLLYHDWRSRVCEQLFLKTDDPWRRAMYLSESVAVSTREARRLIDGKIFPFGFHSVEEFKGAVAKMPPDMTVNELIVTMSGDVYLLRVHSGAAPIVVPLAKESKWSSIMEGFERAMTKSDETAKAGKELNDAKKYWEGRRNAEELMKRAMVDMESDLLGAFAPLLLPRRKLTKRGEAIVTRMHRGREGMSDDVAREIISIAGQTTYDQVKQLVECMAQLEGWSDLQVGNLLAFLKNVDNGEGQTWIEPITELPFVFFVLSTELSRCPWEAISILEGKAHCSRLISLHQLFSLLNSFDKVHSANPLSAFYILDPANDLAATKNRLTPVVEKVPSWKGVTGKAPEKEQVGSIISENDFFIFLGHGNGLRYLSRTTIRRSRCRAVVLLMGCSR
ncbi:hypothetical protein PMAYCL1PPCAC_18363, partial [Pristionchus mayeri]